MISTKQRHTECWMNGWLSWLFSPFLSIIPNHSAPLLSKVSRKREGEKKGDLLLALSGQQSTKSPPPGLLHCRVWLKFSLTTNQIPPTRIFFRNLFNSKIFLGESEEICFRRTFQETLLQEQLKWVTGPSWLIGRYSDIGEIMTAVLETLYISNSCATIGLPRRSYLYKANKENIIFS